MSRRRPWAVRLRAVGGRSLGPVLTLVTGTTAAQALVFLARPVLTRLYAPEAFGLLGVFVAATYLLATLGTLRYDDGVAVPARARDGAGLWTLAVGAALAVGALAALALPLRQRLADALGAPDLGPLLPAIPAVAALLGVGAATHAWLARSERFRPISASLVAQSLVVVGVQLAFAGRGVVGLVAGTAFGALALAAVAAGAAVAGGVLRRARDADLGALARRYRRFPLYGVPATGLSQVALRLPPLALVGVFGPAVVGYLTVALASVAASVGVVTAAVGQVFYVRAAEAHREHRLGPLVERTHARLVAFAAFPVAALALLGPDLFDLVFGADWREAGVYARLLAPWMLLSATAPPLTRAFDATERQRDEFLVGVSTALCVGVALWIGARGGDARAAIGVLSVGGVLGRLVQIGWIFRITEASVGRGAVDLARAVGGAGLWLAPAALAASAGGVWAGLGVAALGGLGYAWSVVRRAPRAE